MGRGVRPPWNLLAFHPRVIRLSVWGDYSRGKVCRVSSILCWRFPNRSGACLATNLKTGFLGERIVGGVVMTVYV